MEIEVILGNPLRIAQQVGVQVPTPGNLDHILRPNQWH